MPSLLSDCAFISPRQPSLGYFSLLNSVLRALTLNKKEGQVLRAKNEGNQNRTRVLLVTSQPCSCLNYLDLKCLRLLYHSFSKPNLYFLNLFHSRHYCKVIIFNSFDIIYNRFDMISTAASSRETL